MNRIVALSPGREVLDVGCGTGIAARQFRAAGCRVLGVDPDARMADLARRYGLKVEVARIEAWDPAGREFDAVVAGQSWHWVDPIAGATKATQALRPGGVLTAFWNAQQPPPELAKAFDAVFDRVMPDLPVNFSWTRSAADIYAAMCAKAADGMREAGGFGEAEQWRFDWEHSYSRDDWLDQLPTSGSLTQAPPDQLAKLLAGVGAAIDAVGGNFTMNCSTLAVIATRKV